MAVFSEMLTSTGVGSSLSWPRNWLRFLPPFAHGPNDQVSFEASDSNDKVWRFACALRRQGLLPKPEVVGPSWLLFVEEHELAVNDEVSFYYDPGQPIAFRVRVRKQDFIRLMGRHIVGYADEE